MAGRVMDSGIGGTDHHTRFLGFYIGPPFDEERCVGHILMVRPAHHTEALMVKWYHTSMVRMNPKFNPWLGHQKGEC